MRECGLSSSNFQRIGQYRQDTIRRNREDNTVWHIPVKLASRASCCDSEVWTWLAFTQEIAKYNGARNGKRPHYKYSGRSLPWSPPWCLRWSHRQREKMASWGLRFIWSAPTRAVGSKLSILRGSLRPHVARAHIKTEWSNSIWLIRAKVKK